MPLDTAIVYALTSVMLVSFISFIGIFTLGMHLKKLQRILLYFISFSAGALFGDAFFHLLPEVVENIGFGFFTSAYILGGIVVFFILERVIQWQHCHTHLVEESHVHSFAIMNLIGDGVHNLLDGIIIGVSYLVSIPVGIATTIAVILHEIPQEIGDFGVLIHGGFSKGRALLLNFASALISLFGVAIVFIIGDKISNIQNILILLTVGGFIYIAGSDLIPELRKHESENLVRSLLQLLAFVAGITIMAALLYLE